MTRPARGTATLASPSPTVGTKAAVESPEARDARLEKVLATLNGLPHEVLGVDRSASKAEIVKAFRALSLEYHPDKNGCSEVASKIFTKVAEAKDTLLDPEKRAAAYAVGARQGTTAFAQQAHGTPFTPASEPFFGSSFTSGPEFVRPRRRPSHEATLEEIFSFLFASDFARTTGRERAQPRRGARLGPDDVFVFTFSSAEPRRARTSEPTPRSSGEPRPRTQETRNAQDARTTPSPQDGPTRRRRTDASTPERGHPPGPTSASTTPASARKRSPSAPPKPSATTTGVRWFDTARATFDSGVRGLGEFAEPLYAKRGRTAVPAHATAFGVVGAASPILVGAELGGLIGGGLGTLASYLLTRALEDEDTARASLRKLPVERPWTEVPISASAVGGAFVASLFGLAAAPATAAIGTGLGVASGLARWLSS